MGQTNGNSRDAVILSGARTPIGRFMGVLSPVAATDLGAVAVRGAMERSGVDPEAVEEVIMGNVIQAGEGQAPARQVALHGGLPSSVGAVAVNKVCGSGLKAVMLASSAIRAGDGDVFVAGGFESMSQAPFLVKGIREGHKYGNMELLDANQVDGLYCTVECWMMGDAAEFIGEEFEVSRQAMDEFALASHQKAVAAQDAGRFKKEIVPVEVTGRKGTTTVDADEAPRRDTSADALMKLPGAFKQGGAVTAGNAPSLNDGAAALVVTSREYAESNGHAPLARVIAYGHAAVDPKWIFSAPAKAMPKVLQKAGWSLEDVDLIEVNEAFAAQVLANGRDMEQQGFKWPWEKVNVNGGAIALGHPLGASGARVLVTLIHALQDRGGKRGLAALCLGGGEAVAMAVEME